MDIWLLLLAVVAFAGFGAISAFSAVRDLSDVKADLPPRGPIGDRYNGLIIVVISLGSVLPQILLLLEIWPRAPVAGALAVFAPLPFALLLGRTLSDGYFAPRAFEGDRIYKWVGVRAFKKFVPDGDLISRAERRRGQAGREMFLSPQGLNALERRGKAAERAHVVSLAAALPSIVLAMWFDFPAYAGVLVAINIIFHVYPILLQRDTRIRLRKAARRS